MFRLTRRLRRAEAWIAEVLLRPRHAGRNVVIAIAAFALAGLAVLVGIKFFQDLFKDSAEAYAWGRQFLGGYGRHPPLTGWIAGIWYLVFPASNWASYLLSRLLVFVSLVGIYGLARHALGARRAALIVFAMMLYPLFIGAKSDRFNNYQVLLALMPLLILAFLVAYEKCTAAWGALLGLIGAAAALTIYAAALPLFAIVLGAALHPGRTRFFASQAPYVALAVFLLLISPHLVWLVRWNFPPLHWVGDQLNTGNDLEDSWRMVAYQVGLLAFPLVGAACMLLPWRGRPALQHPTGTANTFLLLVITVILVVVPPLVSLPLRIRLKTEWGDALFFIVPITLAALLPWLAVRRRAVVRMAALATAVTAIQLVASPLYALAKFRDYPGYDVYAPTSELAREVTRLWRERFGSRLPIVVSVFDLAAPVVFYSPDHPRMLADSPDPPRVFAADQPEFSPWIDFPGDLDRDGFVGICHAHDDACLDYMTRLDPRAEALDVTLVREVGGLKATPWTFHLRIARPRHRSAALEPLRGVTSTSRTTRH
jgi:hypothetical protein